jgi:hypothetical protein
MAIAALGAAQHAHAQVVSENKYPPLITPDRISQINSASHQEGEQTAESNDQKRLATPVASKTTSPTAGKTKYLKSKSRSVAAETLNRRVGSAGTSSTGRRSSDSVEDDSAPTSQTTSRRSKSSTASDNLVPLTGVGSGDTAPRAPRQKVTPKLQLTQYEIDDQGEMVPTSAVVEDPGISDGAPAPEGISVPEVVPKNDTTMTL